jgi:hypothetical protein
MYKTQEGVREMTFGTIIFMGLDIRSCVLSRDDFISL